MACILFLTFDFLLLTCAFGAEWEAADKFTVDGRTLLRSTVTIVSQSSQTYILGLQNPAGNFAVFITTNGRVGVGTTSPGSLLDVAGGIKLGTAAVCNDGADGTLRYGSGRFDLCSSGIWTTLTSTTQWAGSGGNLYLAGGNVAIGTSTANEKLTVDGAISLSAAGVGTSPQSSSGYGKIFAVSGIGGNDSYTKALLHCDGADGSTDFTDSSSYLKTVSNPDSFTLYTKLMLHMNGADGSTIFTDSAGGKTITPVGNAQISTAQYKFGGAAGAFDGAGDYIRVDDSEDWAFGTGNFTIDFRVRFLNTSGYQCFFSQATNDNDYIYMSWTGSSWDMSTPGGPGASFSAADSLTAGQWYHVAFIRNGSTWSLYRDGTLKGSTINSNPYENYTGRIGIGVFDYNVGMHPWYVNGWIDEYRISKGIAQWTTNFSPPSQEYAGARVTVSSSQPQFGTGSARFTKSGEYLSMADSGDWDFGNGDFAVDFWARFNSLPSADTAMNLAVRPKSGGTNMFRLAEVNSSGYLLRLTVNDAAVMDRSWTPSTGAWYHIACTKAGGSFRLFLNGIQQGSASADSSNIADTTPFYVGNQDETLDGWIDEFRVSKGTARWTSGFTPPAYPYDQGEALYYKDTQGNVTSLTGSAEAPSSSVWGQSGKDLYYNGGNVAVGTGPVGGVRLAVGGDDGTAYSLAVGTAANYSLSVSSGGDVSLGLAASTVSVAGALRFADGSVLRSTSSLGGGNVSLASTQTFTGQNTFSNLTTFNSTAYIGGNAGIGAVSPLYKLDVNGGARVTSTMTVDGNYFSVGASTFVVTGGSVGIGTTNPTGILHIAQANPGGITTLFVSNPAASAVNNVARLALGAHSGFRVNNSPYIQAYDDGTGNAGLSFGAYDMGALSEKVRISKTGNVGIGTTAPSGLFQVGGGSLTVLSNGNIGVGTTGPSYTLDVAGDVNTSGSFRVNGTPLITGIGGSGTTGYVPLFATGTSLTNSTIYQTGGNVGIGTTNPGATLELVGTHALQLSEYTTDNTRKHPYIESKHYKTAEEPVAMVLADNQSTASRIFIGGGLTSALNAVTGIYFYTAADNTTLTGTQRMSIDNFGNVGIGAGNPAGVLDVFASTTASNALLVRSGTAGDVYGLFVSTPGSVGIGTANPGQKLDLEGTSPPDWYNGQLRIGGTETTGAINTGGGIQFSGHNGSIPRNWGSIQILKEDSTVGAMASYFRVNVRNATDFFEGLRITSTGNVGIGTTAPTGKLSVQGTGTTYGLFVSTDSAGTVGNLVVTNAGNVSIGTNGSSGKLSIVLGSDAVGINMVGATGQTSDMMRMNSSAGNYLARFTPSGQLGLSDNGPYTFTLHTGPSATDTARLSLTQTLAGGANILLQGDRGGAGNPANGTIYFGDNDYADNAIKSLQNIMGGDGRMVGADLTFMTTANSETTDLAERVRITSGGNVGIGTTAPGTTLDLYTPVANKGIRVGTNDGLGLLHLGNNSGGADAKWAYIGGVFGILVFGKESDDLGTRSEFMRIDASGNVGIGTAAPASRLHGTTTGSGAGGPPSAVRADYTGTTGGEAALEVYHTGAQSGTGYAGYMTKTGAGGTNTALYLSASGGTNNNGLIVNGGNVGIGTTAPTASDWGSASPVLKISGSQPLIDLNDNDGTEFVLASQSDTLYLWDSKKHANRISVDTNGNIGIGTTSAGNLLTLKPTALGDGLFATQTNNNTTAWCLNSWSTGGSLNLYNGGVGKISLDATTGGITYFMNGNFGIGTTSPTAKLAVVGDIYANSAGSGVIVKSPDGTKCARIGISNASAQTFTVITCP